jgi:hypothetical protein
MTRASFWHRDNASTQRYSAGGEGQAGIPSPLGSIHLRIASLSTGEDMLADQVRNKDLFFVAEPLRVSMDTGILPSITPRGNLKATMVPVGAFHRRTQRTVGWLTGGRGVDMKDKCHTLCPFSSPEYYRWCALILHSRAAIHTLTVLWSYELDACAPVGLRDLKSHHLPTLPNTLLNKRLKCQGCGFIGSRDFFLIFLGPAIG